MGPQHFPYDFSQNARTQSCTFEEQVAARWAPEEPEEVNSHDLAPDETEMMVGGTCFSRGRGWDGKTVQKWRICPFLGWQFWRVWRGGAAKITGRQKSIKLQMWVFQNSRLHVEQAIFSECGGWRKVTGELSDWRSAAFGSVMGMFGVSQDYSKHWAPPLILKCFFLRKR